MGSEKKEKEKTGFDILFPEIRVEGYDVKPWTYRQGKTLMPTVSSLIKKIGKFYEDRKGEGGADVSILDRYSLAEIVGTILPEIMDEAPVVLSVSLGITEDEVQEMEMGKVAALYLATLIENAEYLLGFFGKGGGGSQTIRSVKSNSSSPVATG